MITTECLIWRFMLKNVALLLNNFMFVEITERGWNCNSHGQNYDFRVWRMMFVSVRCTCKFKHMLVWWSFSIILRLVFNQVSYVSCWKSIILSLRLPRVRWTCVCSTSWAGLITSGLLKTSFLTFFISFVGPVWNYFSIGVFLSYWK